MKRGGPLRRTKPLTAKKGLQAKQAMRRQSNKPKKEKPKTLAMPKKQKRQASDWEILHLKAVKMQPCCACGRAGPSDAHHCFHDRSTRYGGRKAPHTETIPLCKMCHTDGPNAIHRIKRTWREHYGPDWSYVSIVKHDIYGDPEISDKDIEAWWLAASYEVGAFDF